MSHAVFVLLQEYPFFKWIGAIIVGIKLFNLTRYVFRHIQCYVRESCGFSYLSPSIGKWAVITGGTDGIGKSYAEELAQRGFAICLVSRNLQKLETVAKEIEENYHVETRTINADFIGGPEIYETIAKELKCLEEGIGVLVNNVGMSYKYAEYFHAIPDGANFMMNLIHSNCTSTTMMMRLVMCEMLSRKKGVIINISSLMAVYPMPFLATYAACKVYVDHLSKALQYEYNNSGLIIQSVLPGYVATKMSNRRPRLEIPPAQSYVSSAIKTVGYESCTYGYIAHRVRGFVHEWLRANMPTCVNMFIAVSVMKSNRESYYKKQLKKKMERMQQPQCETELQNDVVMGC